MPCLPEPARQAFVCCSHHSNLRGTHGRSMPPGDCSQSWASSLCPTLFRCRYPKEVPARHVQSVPGRQYSCENQGQRIVSSSSRPIWSTRPNLLRTSCCHGFSKMRSHEEALSIARRRKHPCLVFLTLKQDEECCKSQDQLDKPFYLYIPCVCQIVSKRNVG